MSTSTSHSGTISYLRRWPDSGEWSLGLRRQSGFFRLTGALAAYADQGFFQIGEPIAFEAEGRRATRVLPVSRDPSPDLPELSARRAAAEEYQRRSAPPRAPASFDRRERACQGFITEEERGRIERLRGQRS